MNETKGKILVVDDEKGLRIGTQRLLEDENFTVDTAENGEQGISLGVASDYDLAIIDLKMPDVDGLEVLKQIKSVHPNTICFIATAYASYETAIESTRLGAYGYIPKPFTPDELIYQVEQGFRQRQLVVESELLKKERDENLIEIASEKSRLNTIIKAISDGVLVINRIGELVYFNTAALKYFDLDSLSIGDSALIHLPAPIVEIIKKIYSPDQALQKTYSIQLELKSNNELFVESTCTPILQNDKSIAGVVVVIKNITEFKKIELIKSQFVSMVAHELKTPMAAVQGFLNIILDDSISIPYDTQRDYLVRSVIRLKSLTDLVNDLLDISRMELKTKQREITEIKLDEIVQSVSQMLELELKKKGVTLITHYEEPIPTIKADANEINRIFTNLISNAIKYNKDKGKIDISISHSGSYAVIQISDSGIGMKTEEKNRLFQEFYRAKNEKTRGISGTGLGLSIVKKIVESYYGKIEVESEYGSGTTFIIHFPINTN
ncbi:MAG: ATP-binding protein [Melioribacteraceae bacterium]|nr:ATP-binding protein [Melioribacteraceae bacterium]